LEMDVFRERLAIGHSGSTGPCRQYLAWSRR
jgi:hypothetical protein